MCPFEKDQVSESTAVQGDLSAADLAQMALDGAVPDAVPSEDYDAAVELLAEFEDEENQIANPEPEEEEDSPPSPVSGTNSSVDSYIAQSPIYSPPSPRPTVPNVSLSVNLGPKTGLTKIRWHRCKLICPHLCQERGDYFYHHVCPLKPSLWSEWDIPSRQYFVLIRGASMEAMRHSWEYGVIDNLDFKLYERLTQEDRQIIKRSQDVSWELFPSASIVSPWILRAHVQFVIWPNKRFVRDYWHPLNQARPHLLRHSLVRMYNDLNRALFQGEYYIWNNPLSYFQNCVFMPQIAVVTYITSSTVSLHILKRITQYAEKCPGLYQLFSY